MTVQALSVASPNLSSSIPYVSMTDEAEAERYDELTGREKADNEFDELDRDGFAGVFG